METRANYVLVGAFVLICVAGLFIAALWVAGSQYREEYTYYRTYFTGAVTGLGKGTVVRYNGIDVGHVTELAFDQADPKRVIVTLQIDPTLRLHVDSVASIESQGLTGATYVEITGGTATSAVLVAGAGQEYPVIPSRPSTLQQLAQAGPELLAKLSITGDRVNDLLNDENRKALKDTLENLRSATSLVDDHAEDLDKTLADIKVAVDTLNRTLNSADRAIGSADRALATLDSAAASLQMTSESANATVQKVGKLSDDADKVVNGQATAQFTQLMAQARALVASLTRLTSDLEQQPTKLLFGDQRQGYTPK
ncbi:MAG TPA: MlaD family protein [Micropepsaceae bacterium]|jgi:phospholipid/cholesterol/gamma-HCH transport system substrate-binding protein|nr:MlaD family protein [Micropepsaceae bacterium]